MISAKKLLEGVFEKFLRNSGEKIMFGEVKCEIANDSDIHRTRVGYTSYETATIYKDWIVAIGYKCGAYPSAEYNCDLTAVKADSARNVREALEKTSHFSGSLIVAKADGRLVLADKSPYSKYVMHFIKEGGGIKQYVAQEMEINPGKTSLNLNPVVLKEAMYTEDFVEYLYNLLRQVL